MLNIQIQIGDAQSSDDQEMNLVKNMEQGTSSSVEYTNKNTYTQFT